MGGRVRKFSLKFRVAPAENESKQASLQLSNATKQDFAGDAVRPLMQTYSPSSYQDSQRMRRRQDYAYRIAAAIAALFLLLTWLSA